MLGVIREGRSTKNKALCASRSQGSVPGIEFQGFLQLDEQEFLDLEAFSQDMGFNLHPGKNPKGWGKFSAGWLLEAWKKMAANPQQSTKAQLS